MFFNNISSDLVPFDRVRPYVHGGESKDTSRPRGCGGTTDDGNSGHRALGAARSREIRRRRAAHCRSTSSSVPADDSGDALEAAEEEAKLLLQVPVLDLLNSSPPSDCDRNRGRNPVPGFPAEASRVLDRQIAGDAIRPKWKRQIGRDFQSKSDDQEP